MNVIAARIRPAQLKHAGTARIDAKLKKYEALQTTDGTVAIMEALSEQVVYVAGTKADELAIPQRAAD